MKLMRGYVEVKSSRYTNLQWRKTAKLITGEEFEKLMAWQTEKHEEDGQDRVYIYPQKAVSPHDEMRQFVVCETYEPFNLADDLPVGSCTCIYAVEITDEEEG